MKVLSFIYSTRFFYRSLFVVGILAFSVKAQNINTEDEIPTAAEIKIKEKIAKNKADYEPIHEYQVQIKARKDHEFLLSADYRFYPEKAIDSLMPGVIVLHDCNSQRTKYEKLSITLAEQGLHTLSLDLRGYGSSIAGGYSQREVKQNAKNIVGYDTEIALLKSYWPEDLLAAYNFLRTKIDKSKGISIVAGGCSSIYAVILAESVQVKSMVFLTPEMSYADKERYKNLIDTPSYFISSAQHVMTYKTAQELFTWNGDGYSKHQIYKGDKMNSKLILANPFLVNDIALWLKRTLR